MKQSKKLARPYLSIEELQIIVAALNNSPNCKDMDDIILANKLSQTIFLLSHGIVMGIEQRPKETLVDKITDFDSAAILFSKWQNSPESLSDKELQIVDQYRYINEKMEQEESIKYVKRIFGE